MPRRPRQYLEHIPCHIVQRGNNRTACFVEEQNYQFYLHCLDEALRRYSVALHAYVLMTNHVHLLMTPANATGISRVMQHVGNRYVQYFNKKYQRTGTLWEGRHKSSLIEAERYLLACYRYVELNPVRAGMVKHPGEYGWSSHRHHTTGEPNAMITHHDVFLRLAQNPKERQKRYRDLIQLGLDTRDAHAIRSAATFCTPLGENRFKSQVESKLGRTAGYAARGRPVRKPLAT
jgi:putative transposase